ncbi:MAG TPA: hypothetical protein VE173_09575, partial [Longimicrobiales bacterium]|nr:hypothetical protein [Longimicrobiales bacterium]
MSNSFVRTTVAALALVLGCAATASAQETGRITGVVTDAVTGRPLSGAQVHIPDTEIGILSNAE